MTRREFVYSTGAGLALGAFAQSRPQTAMGIASTTFSGARSNALDFLERCRALGAGGMQTQLNGDPPYLAQLRARAEQAGMVIEGEASLPRNGATAAFEKSLADARQVGARLVRVAALSGRRYETFATTAAWNEWREQTLGAVKLAVPIAERMKMSLALENHKDWTVEEHERLLKSYSSEYFGVCLDFGNNIALLDDPMEVVERLAPYTLTTHVKDMAVQPYDDGFLLSEVPLGTGILDLAKMIATIRKARPAASFMLEMITRDPLKVPCLTDKYWAPFPERNGAYMARTIKLVRDHASRTPLPVVSGMPREDRLRLEEENVKLCLRYGRDKLGL